MPTFTHDDLHEIKARLDIADIIEEHGVHLRRMGSTAKACCPFHKEKTPSFSVNSSAGFYKCFGCGEAGDIFGFLQKMEGITFTEAVQKLAERAGVTLHTQYDPQAQLRQKLYQINAELAAFYQRCLAQTREAEEARAYLDERRLDKSTQERFGLGYAPRQKGALLAWAKHHGYTPDELVAAGSLAPPRGETHSYYDRFHGRITFPICDTQGRIIAFSSRLLEKNAKAAKYVNSPETEIFKKSLTLYGFHLARAAIAKQVPRRAIVCEGQIDVIRCHACGFDTAVASQGTAFTIDHVKLLKKVADSAVLVFDSDAAGVKAAIRTTGLFLSEGMPVRIATLPEGEDPDSLLRTKGPEAFRDCLDVAEDPAPYIVRMLKKQASAPDSMEAVTQHARVIVELIKDCQEPILEAKFLQDAAEALHLPKEALEHHLTLAREEAALSQRRREAYQQRTTLSAEALRDEEASGSFPEEPSAMPIDAEPSSEFDAFVFDLETFESAAAFDEADDTGGGEAITLADLEASRALHDTFCELLFYHFADKGVMECLLKHLPVAFVDDEAASALYALACSAHLKHAATLDVSHENPALAERFSALAARPDKMYALEEDFILAAVRDIVKRYWIREYQRRLRRCDPNSEEALNTILSSKRLEALDWEHAAPYMDALNPPTTPHVAPSVHASDQKSETSLTTPPQVATAMHEPAPEYVTTDTELDFYSTF